MTTNSCNQLFDFLSKDKFKSNYEKERLISLICVVMSYTLRCTAPNHKPCELCICSSTIQRQFVISIDRDGHSINYIYKYMIIIFLIKYFPFQICWLFCFRLRTILILQYYTCKSFCYCELGVLLFIIIWIDCPFYHTWVQWQERKGEVRKINGEKGTTCNVDSKILRWLMTVRKGEVVASCRIIVALTNVGSHIL